MSATDPQAKAEVGREIATELDQIARRLAELKADADAVRYNRAVLRIDRAQFICSSTACGLRQQASKIAGKQS